MIKQISALVFGLAGVAGAAVSGPFTDSQALPNETNVTLTLPKFSVADATLTGVELELRIELTGVKVEMDNDAAAPQKGTALVQNNATSLVSTVNLGSLTKTSLGIYETQVFNLAGTTGDATDQFDRTAANDYGIWEPGTITGGGTTSINATYFAQYQGTGTFTVTTNATYLTSAYFEGSLGRFEGSTPTGMLVGLVTYTFTPIPEPVFMGAMGLAIFGLGTRRTRKA
jgi:hypothetical protein